MVSSDSDRPVLVGLSTYLEQLRWGVWDRPAAMLPASYLNAVIAAGGTPVLLPPILPEVDGAADRVLDMVDVVVLTGGADVDPAHYGEQPHPRTGGLRPDRDSWEMRLLREALDRDLPLLAVCRGAQLLNVALGGTLHQHVPDVVGHSDHQPEPGRYGSVGVWLDPEWPPGSVLGPSLNVPCYHHQSIAKLASELRPVGWADDHTVEAVVIEDRHFVVGVQWHPEEAPTHVPLFAALVAAARRTP